MREVAIWVIHAVSEQPRAGCNNEICVGDALHFQTNQTLKGKTENTQ